MNRNGYDEEGHGFVQGPELLLQRLTISPSITLTPAIYKTPQGFLSISPDIQHPPLILK